MTGTTSGTYTFLANTPIGDVVVEAFERIGLEAVTLKDTQLVSARRSLNLALQEMSLDGVNLWAVVLETITLSQGVAAYSVPANTVNIMDMYISITSGGQTQDRTMAPLSRSDYASIPNKASQGVPSQFWFNRLVGPTITLYLTPDGNGPYTLNYYRMRWLQDADYANGQLPDVHVLFYDALCAKLAAKLALKYAPDKLLVMKQESKEAWDKAIGENRERVPLRLGPDTSGYFRS